MVARPPWGMLSSMNWQWEVAAVRGAVCTELATSEAKISQVLCTERTSAEGGWTMEVCLLRSGGTWMEKAMVLARERLS